LRDSHQPNPLAKMHLEHRAAVTATCLPGTSNDAAMREANRKPFARVPIFVVLGQCSRVCWDLGSIRVHYEIFMDLFSLLFIAGASLFAATDVPSAPLVEKGELLLSDDFQRSDLGDWQALIPTFTVDDGVLRGVQTREDHGAVGRVYRPMRDVVVEFKFKLEGSPGFNAVFDDQKFKGSHAGHICRTMFQSKQVRLADDKEGAMRNDLFAMRSDPKRKAEADKLLAGRSVAVPMTIEQQRWYLATIEIAGDQMRVSVDGRPIGDLRSPGIAHETKTSFHFTVSGPGVVFDDVRIWKAR
jgi:hypothetical protein